MVLAFSILPNSLLHLIKDNIFQQSEKEENNSQSLEQDVNNFNNLESKLSESPEESLETNFDSRENLRQSSQIQIPKTLHLSQIT